MDIHMPILDGIQAAREILSIPNWIPIVMSTGMSDARTVHRAIDLNVDFLSGQSPSAPLS
jgi:CheY-like chemotaxis protein